ncbi:hypothetical protein FACS189437_00910 [Bacteroidia bacterium]|nr:hypothetical protein FACS189437_00910 [Bacteroidia bacterium]
MKKLSALIITVFALNIFAYAEGAPKDNKNKNAKNRQEQMAEFKKQFQAKREQNAAANKILYEQYKAAKTDKEKQKIDGKIQTQAAQQIDEGIALTKKGIAETEESLKKAKERQERVEKNKDEIIAKRVEAIKEGRFGPEAFDKTCGSDACPVKIPDQKPTPEKK